MKTTALVLMLQAAATIIAAGCTSGHGRDAAIPRREAYPRINLYEPEFRKVAVGGMEFEVNDSASVEVDSARHEGDGVWFDIVYPRYGVRTYCTIIPIPDPSALDNRRERMALNNGNAPGEYVSGSSADGRWQWDVLTAASGSSTPVQFLVTDTAVSLMFSGVVWTPQLSAAPADSIAPLVEALEADILHLVKSL